MMIHDPSSITFGTAEEHERTAVTPGGYLNLAHEVGSSIVIEEPEFFEDGKQVNADKVEVPYLMIIIVLVTIIMGLWNVYSVDHTEKRQKADESFRALNKFKEML
ncbi:MAG: hypothetical protein JKY94_11205 [Rhodobacteraceae bacterium]|nr:hypothetical protein [Paracoccaceae bacterium]